MRAQMVIPRTFFRGGRRSLINVLQPMRISGVCRLVADFSRIKTLRVTFSVSCTTGPFHVGDYVSGPTASQQAIDQLI